MFYSKYVLTSHGPLSEVWKAAHWEIVKRQVANETQIDEKCKYIIKPAVPIALRTGGHLLIGVVRIYSKKAQFLLEDCTDAFSKIKVAFRPGAVDLPANQLTAHLNSITISDKDFDNAFDIPVLDLDSLDVRMIEFNRSTHTARDSDITLSGADLDIDLTLRNASGLHDMEIELGRDAMLDESFRPEELMGNDVSIMTAKGGNTTIGSDMEHDISLEDARREDSRLMENDDFGMSGKDFNAKDLEMDAMDMDFGGEEFQLDLGDDMEMGDKGKEDDQETPGSPALEHTSPLVPVAQDGNELVDAPLPQVERTQASQQQRKAPRRPKKKLIIDEETQISSDVMRAYFADASGLVKPRTKPIRSQKEKLSQRHNDLVDNTNFFKSPLTLGMCPELAEVFTRTMGSGPVKGVRQLAPGEKLPEDIEEYAGDSRFFVQQEHDRTLDLNVTMDTLPPMEEAAVDEDLDGPDAKRMRTDEFEFDMNDGGADFDLGIGDEQNVPDPEGEQEEEETHTFSLSQFRDSDEIEDVQVPADQYEMKGAKTQKMLKNLKANFGKKNDLWFLKHIVQGKDRLTAAGALFEILALKTRDYIEVAQAEPYADIHITKTAKFDEIGA